MRKEFFNNRQNSLGLHMINCGYEDCCSRFICAPHFRDYYLIHYVMKGCGYYEVDNKKHKVLAGEIFIIYPNQFVTYYSPFDEAWSFCWIGFEGKYAKTYLEEAKIAVGTYVVKLCNDEFFSNIGNCIEYILETKQNYSQIKLNSFLTNGLHIIEKNADTIKKIKPIHYVEKALRYIEFNYMNPITTKDIANHLYIDRTYFYKIFKKHMGCGSEQYIIHFRIKKSIELIHTKLYTFGEIASFVGINDVYYFSKLFKKVMNMTPTEYKNSFNI